MRKHEGGGSAVQKEVVPLDRAAEQTGGKQFALRAAS
jgi:hypothetical protein